MADFLITEMKIFFGVLAVILQFIATEGQMVPNSYKPENTSSGRRKNPYPSAKNSELNSYSRNVPLRNRRYPDDKRFKKDYTENNNSINKPFNYGRKNNNPVDNYTNNRTPYHNSNYKTPSEDNSYYNNPKNFNSNNRNPSHYNLNKNIPADNYSNDRRPAYFNSKENTPSYFNQNTNHSPTFNSSNSYTNKLGRKKHRKNSHHRSRKPKSRYGGNRRLSNKDISGKDSNKELSVQDPQTSRYNHPAYFSRNNTNPAHRRAPNENPKSPFYTYYQTDPLKGGRIVCLFTAAKFLKSGFKPSMIPARLCTIVNYEFATLNSTTYEMSAGNPDLDYGKKFYNRTIALKRKNPYLKVMLSLGGWADSTKKYSDLVASNKKVKNFISKSVLFLKTHRFDGLDVAWEYPNCWQGAPGVNPQDKPNYAKFLQKLRKAFDKESLLLSISVSSIQREIKLAYDGPAISKAVHFINVMTYDMHGPWEKKTGHHLQFGAKPNDSDPTLNSKAAMEFWASLGVPKIKLNMGIAAYATTFTLKKPSEYGLGAPVKGPGKPGALSQNGGTLDYREICQDLKIGNWTEEEDKTVGFYAHSGDQWAGYDPPVMIAKKTKWIADEGYGGLIIKHVGGDDYEMKCFSMKFPLIWIAGMEFRYSMKKSN